jgi:hypothetical protein
MRATPCRGRQHDQRVRVHATGSSAPRKRTACGEEGVIQTVGQRMRPAIGWAGKKARGIIQYLLRSGASYEEALDVLHGIGITHYGDDPKPVTLLVVKHWDGRMSQGRGSGTPRLSPEQYQELDERLKRRKARSTGHEPTAIPTVQREPRSAIPATAPEQPEQAGPEEPFHLEQERNASPRTVADRDARFRRRVFQRYGPKCLLCGMAVKACLDAPHIRPVANGGSDHPANGLVLCATHHRAFDAGLLGIDPNTLLIHPHPSGPSLAELGIPEGASLEGLRKPPEAGALGWRWRSWRRSTR